MFLTFGESSPSSLEQVIRLRSESMKNITNSLIVEVLSAVINNTCLVLNILCGCHHLTVVCPIVILVITYPEVWDDVFDWLELLQLCEQNLFAGAKFCQNQLVTFQSAAISNCKTSTIATVRQFNRRGKEKRKRNSSFEIAVGVHYSTQLLNT